ncbi:MAG: CBS domain-containing protein, partial [Anaerolineales bacterium]
ATVAAVGVGQAVAFLMGIFGFLQGNFFWVLIAIFIYSGAGQERQMVLERNILGGLTVEQAFSRGAQHLSPLAPLKDAVDITRSTFQSDFPICEGPALVGLLTHTRLIEALGHHGPDIAIGEVMLRDIAAVAPEDGLLFAQQRLSELGVGALPVVRDGTLVGLITNRDISEIYRLASIRADLLTKSSS